MEELGVLFLVNKMPNWIWQIWQHYFFGVVFKHWNPVRNNASNNHARPKG